MKYKIACDIHTHTIASGHAYGTIREMAKAASEKGLELLGISEHAPGIHGTCEPVYFWNLKNVPKVLYGVEIFHGSELNVLNDGTLSLSDNYIYFLDYGIVGIHLNCYENVGPEKNTDNLIECMKHPKVNFISHPDSDDTPVNYERLVKAAKKYDVALEVNNSSLVEYYRRINCHENYRTMLKLCMEHRTNIVVNSDAHDPQHVGRVNLALELLEEVGFDEELIVNTSKEKFKEFITRKTRNIKKM
ncbi:MAG: phosphatase [Bacillota bacterium]|nr:phosphatase [Bacillota bacterium]NLL26363.1 phosphatase [Erysipelotrichia bacterium]